ncbi:MAG: hypothetical protein IKZ82_09715 [Clostridia bacterium]|nr:hypothetical protein [Clostridia bacterium]
MKTYFSKIGKFRCEALKKPYFAQEIGHKAFDTAPGAEFGARQSGEGGALRKRAENQRRK